MPAADRSSRAGRVRQGPITSTYGQRNVGQRVAHNALESPRPPIAAILAQCPDHSLGVTIDDGQQHPGCPIGNAPALFPFLNSPHIETEAIGELLPAQPQPLAERDNPAGGGIVDDPTRQTRLAANMGQNLAQSRFDLTSEVGAFHRHQTRQRLGVRRGQILAIRLRISRQQQSCASSRQRPTLPSNPRDTARDGPAQILHDPYPIKRVVASRASCRVAGSMPTDRGAA